MGGWLHTEIKCCLREVCSRTDRHTYTQTHTQTYSSQCFATVPEGEEKIKMATNTQLVNK